jgi:hypothetical protein
MVMEMIGGIDTGVYFSFKGTALRPIGPHEHVGGRKARKYGFCSEAIMPTREEKFNRGGHEVGYSRFFARCEERRTKFEQWMQEYYKMKKGNTE